MPRYQYECTKCKHIIDRSSAIAQRNDDVECDKCGHKGEAVIYFSGTPIIQWKCEAPTKPGRGKARHGWAG
jgi:putative FmdB family regulatory protein